LNSKLLWKIWSNVLFNIALQKEIFPIDLLHHMNLRHGVKETVTSEND